MTSNGGWEPYNTPGSDGGTGGNLPQPMSQNEVNRLVTSALEPDGDLVNNTFSNYGPQSLSLKTRSKVVCDIREFSGFDGTFNNSQVSLVTAWLTQGATAGVPCVGPPNVTLAIDSSVYVSLTNKIVEVSLPSSFVLKSTSNLSATMVRILDHSFDEHTISVFWRGGTFDNKLGVFIQAAGSNSCIGLERCYDVLIEGARFYGANDFFTAGTTTDSGITAADCKRISIINNFIHGQGDCAMYLGGSDHQEALNIGENWLISGNQMSQSGMGIGFKRQANTILITENMFADCWAPVCNVEAGSGTIAYGAGRLVVVSNNIAKRSFSNFYRDDGGSDVRVTGNYVEDWGYYPTSVPATDGTVQYALTVNSTPAAAWIRGTTNARVDDNTFVMNAWANFDAVGGVSPSGGRGSTTHCGICLVNYDLTQPDGITTTRYTIDYFRYARNTFKNVYKSVWELNNHGIPGPSFGEDNTYYNTNGNLVSVNTSSNYRWFDHTKGWWRTFNSAGQETYRDDGTNSYSSGFKPWVSPSTSTGTQALSGITRNQVTLVFGTVAANATVDQIVPMAGLNANNDTAWINPVLAANAPTGITYTCFVQTDQVMVRAANATATPVAIPSGLYTINVVSIG